MFDDVCVCVCVCVVVRFVAVTSRSWWEQHPERSKSYNGTIPTHATTDYYMTQRTRTRTRTRSLALQCLPAVDDMECQCACGVGFIVHSCMWSMGVLLGYLQATQGRLFGRRLQKGKRIHRATTGLCLSKTYYNV